MNRIDLLCLKSLFDNYHVYATEEGIAAIYLLCDRLPAAREHQGHLSAAEISQAATCYS